MRIEGKGGGKDGWASQPIITRVEDQGVEGSYRRIRLETSRGTIHARQYGAPDARTSALMVGGAEGGFASPARGLYPRLAESLASAGAASLWLRFRDPTELEEAIHDLLAGIRLLGERGSGRVALVGYAFGAAAAISAGAISPEVATVVAIATQSYGVELAGALAPRPLLLVHGEHDEILPLECSERAFALAGEPKALRIVENARHALDEAPERVHGWVHEWLVEHLIGLPARRSRP